uniref:RING-type domain-containing protein n=1 Tax=Panagrolaimus superbus TaxID=310955 RepID=A0A914XV67_9BILA
MAMALRRSARLAALQDRRRESEENALRQQRERIARTHRNVSRVIGTPSISIRLPTPPASSSTSSRSRTRGRISAPSNDTEYPRLVRNNAVRRRHQIMANPQLTTRSTNTNITGRMRPGRFPNRAMRTGASNRIMSEVRPGERPLFLYDTQELRDSVFNIGLILGNRYSSDSEDSYFQPRVIDPDAISEDESEEESPPMREPTPPPPPPPPANRRITRSMSGRPGFYEDPQPSTLPRSILKKKVENNSMCKCKGASSLRDAIKVEKVSPCTICYEEEPKKPVACTYCRQIIGCRHCVKKWFYTTNMSHLDQRTPYPIGGTDRNHKRCPLCRADWPDTPQIMKIEVEERAVN